VRVTTVPLAYAAEQTEPQLIPLGLLPTLPGPFVLTVRVYAGKAAKVAVTVTDTFPARVHGSVPLQPPPDQPLKVDPDEGVAARVTTVPAR
jgi:hypothetical protein